MPWWLLRPLRFVFRAWRDHDSSRQLAFGIAVGMVIGLVPKGNLTALTLGVILLASRANLASATLSALVFSWIAAICDPLAHRAGRWLLTIESLQPLYARCQELPIVPWTHFNNTVVAGQLMIGLALFYPTYWVSRQAIDKHGPRLSDRWQSSRLHRCFFGAWTAPSGGSS